MSARTRTPKARYRKKASKKEAPPRKTKESVRGEPRLRAPAWALSQAHPAYAPILVLGLVLGLRAHTTRRVLARAQAYLFVSMPRLRKGTHTHLSARTLFKHTSLHPRTLFKHAHASAHLFALQDGHLFAPRPRSRTQTHNRTKTPRPQEPRVM
ncbi:hypothetical protein B0H13DRAFT_2357862 [Mycena leptocephala]|nr:hypothetical protein B0H13DRAFT_2357862 [Mycena leptocephala]